MTGATYKSADGSVYLIHFSDDVLISCKPTELEGVKSVINKRFSIDFGPIDRWVSMEIACENGVIEVSTIEAASGMSSSSKLFKLASLNKLSLDGDKKDVPTSFRSSVGKLNYLATFNPHLRYYVSYLSEAANYDPPVAEEIVQSLLFTAACVPFKLIFDAHKPNYVAIYCDANHSLKSLRGYWGCVVQLQVSDEPEDQRNVIFWTGGRLAKQYDSVYVAELKAAMNALVEFAKIRPIIREVLGDLPIIMFSDNKAMVTTLNTTKEVHPFACNYADFCRTSLKDMGISMKWCPSAENHADKLTKPTRWI